MPEELPLLRQQLNAAVQDGTPWTVLEAATEVLLNAAAGVTPPISTPE